jgi:hypothetical protein
VLAALVCALTVAAYPADGLAKSSKGDKPAKGGKTKGGKRATRGGSAAGLFGTADWEPASAEEFHRMAIGGLSSLRVQFYPRVVEPTPGVRDWRLYDQLIGDGARSGITIEPLLFGVPAWVSDNAAMLPTRTQAGTNEWFDFVRDAASRYGPGGSFWRQNPSIPAHPITGWEVWNEPNINLFTGSPSGATPAEYAGLLRLTRAALNAAGPGNRVFVGGLYRRPKPGDGIRMTRYLQRLYKLRHGKSLFDGVAIHPYATRPLQVLQVTQSIRRLMNRNGDRRKPIWITELGWTTGGQYWGQSLYRTTLTQQANRVGRTAALLVAHRKQLGLQKVIWHTWRDRALPDDFWDGYMGLFTVDGVPKPAWNALTRVTGGVAGGQITNIGHFQPPFTGPLAPPVTGGAPEPPPEPGHSCVLLIFCS